MRKSGILLHLSSLPSDYGIGTLGEKAYAFVDFLVMANKRYWQMLPIGPTSYGDSPYQSFSSFAGNPYFIDLDILCSHQLLRKSDYEHLPKSNNVDNQIDYAYLYQTRYDILRLSFQNFNNHKNHKLSALFESFINEQQAWLFDYAVFMSLKDYHDQKPWWQWQKEYKFREKPRLDQFIESHQKEIRFWQFVQFLFFTQWSALKKYASQKNVKLIGDLPIYVARDSCDMWVNPKMWLVDKKLEPTVVAGCPPDYFASKGQLWGNPIYNYRLMKKDKFSWWIKRLEATFKLFDVVRIDHFRGFASYYAVNSEDVDATKGKWYKGPGYQLFRQIKEQLGDVDIIAEDLGFLTKDVNVLLAKTRYPGMKVLQFAFDAHDDSIYLPHHITANSVVYPGTHDNMTINQWYDSLDNDSRQFLHQYLNIGQADQVCEAVIRACLASTANLAIIPIQDYLKLNAEGRMNTPSTMVDNWQWRLKKDQLTERLAREIRDLVWLYRRS